MKQRLSMLSVGNFFLSARLTLALRLLLGFTFLVFGAAKLADLNGFEAIVAGYDVLPAGIGAAYSHVLPLAEVIIGITLILGFGLRFASIIAVLVVASLIAGTAISLYGTGKSLRNCGCILGVEWPPGVSHLAVQGVMLVMSVQIFLHRGTFLNLDSLLSENNKPVLLNRRISSPLVCTTFFLAIAVGLTAFGIVSFFTYTGSVSFPAIHAADLDSQKTKIVIYSDFQCGACERLNSEVEPVLRQSYVYTGKADIEVRLLPTLGADSMRAALATLCAADYGYFQEYRDTIFREWRENDAEAYSQENLAKVALSLGINEDMFISDLSREIKKAEIEKNMALARSDAVHTLPAVIIKDTKIEGHRPLQDYVNAVDRALSRR